MVFLAGTAYVFCTGSVVSAAPPASSRRTGNRRCLITSAMRDLPLRLRITNALGGAGTYFKHDLGCDPTAGERVVRTGGHQSVSPKPAGEAIAHAAFFKPDARARRNPPASSRAPFPLLERGTVAQDGE
jgi:hypothetical protein